MSKSTQKGTSFERLIADYWAENWDDLVDRRVKMGVLDKGDIANFRLNNRRVVVECKNVKAMSLAGWVDEANKERDNDKAYVGIVVHKRKGKGKPEDQYVTMDMQTFMDIIRLIGS